MTSTDKLLSTEVSPFKNGQKYRIGDWQNVPEIVHDAENIKGFFGEYRWLSNFGEAVIALDTVRYDGIERAYQAAKWQPHNRSYFTTCTNNASIIYNRERSPDLYTLEEWEVAKLGIMRGLLEQKFDPAINPDNTMKLSDTGDRYLEETNWWGDTFWGKNLAGEGENNLGKMIMEIRSGL